MKRRITFGLAFCTLALAASSFLPGCAVKYVLSSGYYQAELLASRRPVDEVIDHPALGPAERERLLLVREIKAFGRRIGLSATENYETIAWGWDRTIWNLSACEPLAFQPVTWWFPIVGRVPYLGFFTDAAANTWRVRLEAKGYDVHLRTAGAYSTLGWFEDPILPGMLRWSEAALAETVLHELAHATLWIPGSVAFNETFASVVGDTAARQYLVDRHGPDAPEVRAYDVGEADWLAFQALLHGLYGDLDAVYRDPALDDAAKLRRKEELVASLDDRVLASPIEQKPRYLQVARESGWNNARLMQFRTYNANEHLFEAVLARTDHDILAFIGEVERITRGADDPFAALTTATGAASDE